MKKIYTTPSIENTVILSNINILTGSNEYNPSTPEEKETISSSDEILSKGSWFDE